MLPTKMLGMQMIFFAWFKTPNKKKKLLYPYQLSPPKKKTRLPFPYIINNYRQ